jgi:hypothetical protein
MSKTYLKSDHFNGGGSYAICLFLIVASLYLATKQSRNQRPLFFYGLASARELLPNRPSYLLLSYQRC